MSKASLLAQVVMLVAAVIAVVTFGVLSPSEVILGEVLIFCFAVFLVIRLR